jgi:hypothetical protein
MFVDLHIELSSIIAYFNDQVLSGKQMPATAKQVYEYAIGAYAEIPHKPFLVAAQADDDYYQRYLQESVKEVEKTVPDFFEYQGDFYDLNETHYIRREEVGDEVFGLFFQLKLEEIQDTTKTHLSKFYDFQLYDNFYGNKDEFDNFLKNLPATADYCWQLPEVSDGLNSLIIDRGDSNSHNLLEKVLDNDNEQTEEWKNYLSSRRGYLIPSIWTDDEVKAFFSFLYKYKSAIGESLLSKEEFDTIFQHGLRIPEEPLSNKISLRNTPQIPKRLLDAGVHLFWSLNGRTAIPKSDLLLFFANHLKQYEVALLSKRNLDKVLSNIKKYPNYPEFKFKRHMPSRIVL